MSDTKTPPPTRPPSPPLPQPTADTYTALAGGGVETKRRNLRNYFAAVKHSVEGFCAALKHEPSFRQDLLLVILLIPVAALLPVNAVSSALMIASLLLIMIVELINSAIEWTIDYVRPEIHPLAKRVKDMAAAAVFLSYINALVVWAILLWPSRTVWERLGHLFAGNG